MSEEPEGSALLSRLADFIGEYVAFPSPEAGDAVALWAVHAHALDYSESTPRLALLSAEKQSGKTRTLEVLEFLIPNAKHASNLTPAALFRLVSSVGSCTLLFDEVDVFFGHRAKEHEELRGLLNAGHRRGAVAYRCVGEPTKMKVEPFAAYAAAALAGIGGLPDTILDRAVLIRMRRRAPDEVIKPFRRREVEPKARELADWIQAWTEHHQIELEEARPPMPDGITDRPADVWEPLLAIADAAGGVWPERARRAAVRLNGELQGADPSLGLRLLTDIRQVFESRATDRLTSAALADALNSLEESPWGDLRGRPLDTRHLARRLRDFDVEPHVIRLGDSTPRGYELADFSDAFKRYLPASPESPQHPQQPQLQVQMTVADESRVADPSATRN